ncbi:MAG TPA: hypothetical protein VJT50_08235 [Pyrinomonadaceae bacterium]|nr:hypothetical protein [Pyrinomonadaceae bacterium]
MHKIFSIIFLILLLTTMSLVCAANASAQTCQEPQTTGNHSFRQQGERFEIPIMVSNCAPTALEVRWSNGRNNGSNFHVTFFDSDNQAIYTRELSGFLSGSFMFPLATLEQQPWFGQGSLISVPVKVTIEAVRPFALPASISYKVTRTQAHTELINPETTIEKQSDTKANRTTPVNGKSITHRAM